MGVRPHLYMVVGINDAKLGDPRYDGSRWADVDFESKMVENVKLDHAPIYEYLYTGDRKTYGDMYLTNCVYNHEASSEYHAPGVVGYILDELDYASDIVYELVQVINGDDEEKYRVSGHIVRGNHPTRVKKRGGNDAWDLALKENRAIAFERPYVTSLWFDMAIELLHQAGWFVDRSMLKIMLVWHWS